MNKAIGSAIEAVVDILDGASLAVDGFATAAYRTF